METEDFDVVIDLTEEPIVGDEAGLFNELLEWFDLQNGETCLDIQKHDCYFYMIPWNWKAHQYPYEDTKIWWMPYKHPVAMMLEYVTHEEPLVEIGDSEVGICVIYDDDSVNRGIAELLSFFKRQWGKKNEENEKDKKYNGMEAD